MWILFDCVDRRSHKVVNVIKDWTLSLQKKERSKLNQKLDMLEYHGPELSPRLLSGTGNRKIFKIRVNGEVALRLYLCKGPINQEMEFTLLFGAMEKDRKLIPRNALEIAEKNRKALIHDIRKRIKHERIS